MKRPEQLRKYFYRGGGWEYRMVVVGKSGRVVPLGNWKLEMPDEKPGLEECKMEASKLAGLLDCPCLKAPPFSHLVVRAKHGSATVTFAPSFGRTRLKRWALLIIALLVVAAYLLTE